MLHSHTWLLHAMSAAVSMMPGPCVLVVQVILFFSYFFANNLPCLIFLPAGRIDVPTACAPVTTPLVDDVLTSALGCGEH